MSDKSNKNLKKENEELRKKLLIAKTWMKKEIKNQISKIEKIKVTKESIEEKNEFLNKNIDDIIINNIHSFFWDFLLMNAPASAIENIISAEISYYNLRENPNSDWFSVISSYHKSLDSIIESFITKNFRKFAKKKEVSITRVNDTLEKSLKSVINMWYILSLWRLYHVSSLILKDKKLLPIANCFKEFLEKYDFIKKNLLDKDFHKKFRILVESEIFWKKRHSGRITFVETRKARRLLIWDFEDKNCIFYKLLEIWKIDF